MTQQNYNAAEDMTQQNYQVTEDMAHHTTMLLRT